MFWPHAARPAARDQIKTKKLRFDSLVARYYPAIYSFAAKRAKCRSLQAAHSARNRAPFSIGRAQCATDDHAHFQVCANSACLCSRIPLTAPESIVAPQHMLEEGPRAPNPQDELAKFVRERVEKRKYCMVFESQLEPCWPAEKVKSAARTTREKKILAFAKANGWTAVIHDPGLSVIFKKITA